MQVPDDLLYTAEHEWINYLDDSTVRIGITDYAQDQLGDVVYVELPEEQATIAKDDLLVEVESTKSVGEVYAPVAGTISTINQAVVDAPELVNESPYEKGWFVELSIEGGLDTSGLLDAAAYRDLTE